MYKFEEQYRRMLFAKIHSGRTGPRSIELRVVNYYY